MEIPGKVKELAIASLSELDADIQTTEMAINQFAREKDEVEEKLDTQRGRLVELLAEREEIARYLDESEGEGE